jgi:ribosome assembly protein 3
VKAVKAAKTARKRNRKRKRRIASSSDSPPSESSESSSPGSEDERPSTAKLKTQVSAKPVVSEESLSSSECSESESDSESSSDHHEDDVEMVDASVPPTGQSDKRERVVYSRSPSPVPASVPSFLPTKPDGSVDTEGERRLKDRFRKFWMQSVADAFQDDLAQIHKAW